MAKIKLTAQAKKDLADGKNAVVSYQGKDYLVSKGLLYYAYTQFLTGGDVEILVPVVGNGMELLTVNV